MPISREEFDNGVVEEALEVFLLERPSGPSSITLDSVINFFAAHPEQCFCFEELWRQFPSALLDVELDYHFSHGRLECKLVEEKLYYRLKARKSTR